MTIVKIIVTLEDSGRKVLVIHIDVSILLFISVSYLFYRSLFVETLFSVTKKKRAHMNNNGFLRPVITTIRGISCLSHLYC